MIGKRQMTHENVPKYQGVGGGLLREVESVTLLSVVWLFGTFTSFQRKTFLSKFRMDLEVTEACWVFARNDRVAVGFWKGSRTQSPLRNELLLEERKDRAMVRLRWQSITTETT